MSAERDPTFLLPENPTLQKDKIRREKTKRNKKWEFFQKTKGVLPENGGEVKYLKKC